MKIVYDFIEYVLSIFRDSLVLVLIAGALFAVVVTAAYFFHKRKFHGEKKFPWGKVVLWLLFAGYIAIVLYATLMRMSGFHMQYNLHLFKAWREAWNNYSVKNIANVLLNVAMFVPLGFLLPLLWKLCRKWYVAIPSGFGFSLAIELIQLLTRRGVCDVDDLFCNTLGAAIGYFLIMLALTIVEKKWKPALIYSSLSLACILSICSIFLIYNTQEYGNLPIAPSYTIDMSDVKWTLDCQLPETAAEAPVYQTRRRTLQDCDVFAEEFRKIIPTEYNTISYYEEAAYYMDNGSDGGAHFLYVYYADQSYSYDALYDDELDVFFETLKIFFANIPYDISSRAPEETYQAVFCAILYFIGVGVTPEVRTNEGRIDAVMETPDRVYVMEFKRDKSASEALAQIKEKKYYEKFLASDKKITLVGVSFDSDKRTIAEWVTEEIQVK